MDFKKIISDSQVATVRMAISILSTLLLIPVITKYIGESEYGIWVTIIAISSIFISLGGAHLHGALIRYKPKEAQEGQTLVDTLTIILASSIIVCLLFFIIGLYSSIFNDIIIPENRLTSLAIVSSLIFTRLLLQFLSNYPRAREQVKIYDLLMTIKHLSDITVLPITLFLTREIFLGIASVTIVYLVLILSILWYYYPDWRLYPNINNFKKYLKYGLPMIPKEMSGKVVSHSDKFIILVFLSPVEVAIYSVSYKVVSLFRSMSGVLNSTLYPSVTDAWESGEYQELSKLYEYIIYGYSLIGIPALAGLTILAYPVLELLSTQNIADQGSVLVPILGFGFFIWGYENPLAYLLTADEDTDKIAVITIVTAILNVILNLILIPVFGLIGAAIATISSHILKTSYMFYICRNKVRISIPTTKIIKITISSVLMFSVLYILSDTVTGIRKLIAFPVIGISIYLIMLYSMGGIPIDQLKKQLPNS